jgi:hypothetical protein
MIQDIISFCMYDSVWDLAVYCGFSVSGFIAVVILYSLFQDL